jgi:hypothetical protein
MSNIDKILVTDAQVSRYPTKIKIFNDQHSDIFELEEKVNEFIKDKSVIDVKINILSDYCKYVTVIYKE